MADLNLKLPTGRVVGRFITEVQDNDDPDMDPQLVPAVGRVTIKSAIDYLKIDDSIAGVFTTFRGPHVAVLDEDGYLSTPHPDTNKSMYPWMSLWANDSENISVKGWTYTASFELRTRSGKSLELPPVTFELGTNEILDLSEVVKVPSTPGYGLPQAEAAAIRAANSAEKSEGLLLAATQIAQSIRDDADSGRFDGAQGPAGNATLRVDTTVGKRVLISDGTSEYMVIGETGIRDITTLAPNVTSGKIFLYRDDSTVTMVLDAVQMSGANGGSYDMVPSGVIPIGFRPPKTNWYHSLDGPPSVRRLGVAASGWVPVYLSPVPGDVFRGTISWQTKNPWPTSLPGLPA